MKKTHELFVVVVAAVGIAALSFVGVRQFTAPPSVPPDPTRADTGDLATTATGAESESGVGRAREFREIVFVVVAASRCAFSQPATLRPLVDSIRGSLSREALARGMSLTMVGIAIDRSASVGLSYLNSLGDFDEIVAGGRWLNAGALYYVRNHLAGPLATPQVIVLERTTRGGDEKATQPESMRLRLTGLRALQQMSKTGFRVPAATPTRADIAPTPN